MASIDNLSEYASIYVCDATQTFLGLLIEQIVGVNIELIALEDYGPYNLQSGTAVMHLILCLSTYVKWEKANNGERYRDHEFLFDL